MKNQAGGNGAGKQIAITAICVHALCADGKTRKVRLRPGHAHKLHNWIRVASGGQVHLYDVPVAIVAAEPKEHFFAMARRSLGEKLSGIRFPKSAIK